MMKIKVYSERLRDDYKYWTAPNRKLGRPLVINVREYSPTSKTRNYAENDRDMLKRKVLSLGFDEPYVIDSIDTESSLYNKSQFFQELETIANDDPMTKNADVFLCIVMAFGEGGRFFLPQKDLDTDQRRNQGRRDYENSVEINDVINIFKVDHCPKLACKPKIFIIHTEHHLVDLKIYEDQLGNRGSPQPKLQTIPVESDILVYRSEFSDEYVEKARETDNTSKGGGDIQTLQTESYFIYTLCTAADQLIKDKVFDLNQWILLTNSQLHEFIKKGQWKIEDPGIRWRREPSLPMCTLQTTKRLVVNL